jgi:DNA-binding SARP family transcriptional activator
MDIRLLGPLHARRADGTVVDVAEWRTCKTLDLFRLLALHNGRAVPAGTLTGALWPEVDEGKARASLRTAASQLRKILGEGSIERRSGGLALVGAWVDTQSYEGLVSAAAASHRVGDHVRTVATVAEAESLYVDDLEVPENAGEWLHEEHDRLRQLRCRALLEAAEAAAALCWMRDSLDLARAAAAIDSCEETSRALMRALAGVGELDKALEVFDRTRQDLAQRYGVDPSPQTRALHLQLLTGMVDCARDVGLVGHGHSVLSLTSRLSMLAHGQGRGVVWLEGEEGSGRDHVLATACRNAGLTLHDLGRDAWLHDQASVSAALSDVAHGDVVLMPHADTVPPHALKVVDRLAQNGQLLVVPVREAPELGGDLGVTHKVEHVGPLDDQELLELAEVVLQGTPSGRLMQRLADESEGLSGTACRVARSWLAAGRVVWSVEGLELAEGRGAQVRGASATLRRSLRVMSPFAEDLVNALAVAGSEADPDDVVAVVLRLHPNATADEVMDACDQLVDGGHVVVDWEGLRLRQDLAGEVVAWMRPTLLQQLRRLTATELVSLPLPRRVELLVEARETNHAMQLGTAALEAAEADGDLEVAASLRAALAVIPAQSRPRLVSQGTRSSGRALAPTAGFATGPAQPPPETTVASSEPPRRRNRLRDRFNASALLVLAHPEMEFVAGVLPV